MWTEGKIARMLARGLFKSDLCVLPNCTWTGHEIDLLVVTSARRIVDVEIKISRADLRADKHKAKWWHYLPHVRNAEGVWERPREPRAWPTKVWKQYYCMPADIWRQELLADVQPVSGVLLVHDTQRGQYVECIKRAKACRDAQALTDGQVIAIARLASLRMWDAYAANERIAAAERSISHGLITTAEARAEMGGGAA